MSSPPGSILPAESTSARSADCTHTPPRGERRDLAFAFATTAGFMLLEVAGGLVSGSLALLSDAGHMFTDAAALALSLFAVFLAGRPPDQRRTYGYHRVEILAALVNAVFLWVVVFFILLESYRRLHHPAPVRLDWMLGVGAAGLLVNVANLAVLRRGRRENLNVRAAFLHVLGDALGSVGVVAAGVVMWTTGWTGADAAAAALISLLILWSSWGLVREAVHILLEGVPGHVSTAEIAAAVRGVPGVAEVHDLHVWTLSPRMVLLTAHVVAPRGSAAGSEPVEPEEPDAVRKRVERVLQERFAITHTTLQMELDRCQGECETSESAAPACGHDRH
jgi:cobalt-zinc-cadmium efflux system protein